jgi:mannose-6-phosphate isomerase-like protein (cupin superfamily)
MAAISDHIAPARYQLYTAGVSSSLVKVNLAEAFSHISEAWAPRVGGDINDAQVKLAKLAGTFHWHHHEHEDELFLVIAGTLRMRLRDGDIVLHPGEYLIVPRGVEHCPETITDEVHCLLLEPRTTLNTGNVVNERTRVQLDSL